MNIYILHEQGAKKHYRALSEMQEKKGVNVVFRELSVFKNLIRSIFRKDVSLFFKQVVNAMFLLRLAVKRNDVLIVAIAPYDWRLLVVYKLIKKHKYYYHTSHTDWGYKSYPKKFLAQTKCSKNIWTKFIENSAGVFCATKKTSDEIAVNYTNDKISVVNHSLPKCYDKIQSEDVIRPIDKTVKCVFIGRYDYSKGIGKILDLIDCINLSKMEVEFGFIGSGVMSNDIESYVNKYGNVKSYGYIDSEKEIMNILIGSDYLLLPSLKKGSWEELFGMVIIEAMCCGTIPITTDHSGPKEIISNGCNGYIFSEKLYVEKALEMINVLSYDDDLFLEIKSNAFKRGREYTAELIFERWNKLLRIS